MQNEKKKKKEWHIVVVYTPMSFIATIEKKREKNTNVAKSIIHNCYASILIVAEPVNAFRAAFFAALKQWYWSTLPPIWTI